MQYSVPQFIDIEDKVVGPLTAKQALILILGGAILLVAFKFFNLAFFLIIAALVVPVSLVLAFYKPRGISALQYVFNYVDFFANPKIYLWQRETDQNAYFKRSLQKKQSIDEAEPIKNVSYNRIRDLAVLLDTSTTAKNLYDDLDKE